MIYLDNAATSFHKPEEVVAAVSNSIRNLCANPGRSGHSLSMLASEKVYETRCRLDNFFNGYGGENVSFTANCTQSLNMAIKGVMKKGEHVIISSLEHNSVLRPVNKLREMGICDYSVFEVCEDDKQTLENFRNAFQNNTSLCVVTAVSNVFGNILPLKRLSEIAHENGALFFVDGAQGAGVIEIDMKKQGIDCLCIPGHKGLLGIMGIGAILHNNLIFDTIIEGGTGTESFLLSQPAGYPERLESGTVNLPGICSLGAGVDFVNKKGINTIFQYESQLVKYTFDGLKNIKNVELYCDNYNKNKFAPVLSFNIKNRHSERVSTELNAKGIAVRGGYHCSPLAHKFNGTEKIGTVRISPSFFNTKKEINIMLNLLEKIAISNLL